jgi:hypothetical protein
LDKYIYHLLAFGIALVFFGGCESVDPSEGYRQGSLYRTDIDTVFVQMFESESFRREVEYELTRATSQQLELQSPYKVVSDRRKADSVLHGRIQGIDERVLTRQRELDRPLENEVILVVKVTWKDLRSGQILLDDVAIKVSGDYAALLGEGRNSATRTALNQAAVRIVEAMERPW